MEQDLRKTEARQEGAMHPCTTQCSVTLFDTLNSTYTNHKSIKSFIAREHKSVKTN